MQRQVQAVGRSRWAAFAVFVVALVVVFVLLGRWQLHRASAQHLADARQATAMAAPAVDVGRVLQPGAAPDQGAEWRQVTATGIYDPDHVLLVRNRTLDSANGYLIMVPLRTAGSDLLVVRGWIPSGPTAAAPAALPTLPRGEVTVTGRVRLPEPASERSGLPAGQVERVVPSEVATLTGRATYGGWLALQAENPAPTGEQAGLRTLPADGSSGWTWPISHTVYAMQWFTFAVIAVVGFFVLLRRDVREAAPTPPAVDRAGTGG